MSLRKVIGIHACRETLKARSSKELKKIYFRPEWDKNPLLRGLAERAKAKNLRPEVISLKKLNQIGESNQGVCVIAELNLKFDIHSVSQNSVVLILDGLQDPRNFGAIIRTSWLAGVDGIFISSRHSVKLSPLVMKSASGGAEYVPVEKKDNLRQYLEELKKHRFWIYALDPQAENSVWKERFDGRVAFALGGESGLRKSLKKACDKALFIPQKNLLASYNVSVSTGIVLGERFRQRRLDGYKEL